VNILVVEDDPGIADVLDYALRKEGHGVRIVARGREAVALASQFDIVLLDVGLPDIDGFDVCRQIRADSNIPVIFLTSRSEEIDRVVGLELGGDDYIAKPFSTRELMARIKAIMRRASSAPAKNDGGLALDRDMHQATLDGRELSLSRLEFDLLALLFDQPGRVYTREQILDQAWPDGGCVTDRTVDAHVKALRKKLGDPDMIETIRGVGYRLRA
jgi:two-component system catabolic regulation response regulator CreB